MKRPPTNVQFLTAVISEALVDEGFIGKKKTWYRVTDETTMVVDLQKSNFGEQFYINLAVCINDIMDDKYPKESQCHIRRRLCSLTRDPDLKQALDFENEQSGAWRAEKIRQALNVDAKEFFLHLATVESIASQLTQNKMDGIAFLRSAREYVMNYRQSRHDAPQT